jgi:hypothetical protein
MIQDLAHSDNARVDAALAALNLLLLHDKENRDTVTLWGGCAALVHFLKDRLKKATKKVSACDQVSELNELAELKTLHKTLGAIVNLTCKSEMGKLGIVTVGGVEAVVRVMKTFSKCQALQEYACCVLRNLVGSCSIGKVKVIESGGIELLLAAVNNHLNSADVCQYACWALRNIASGSKENTGLLISLGGGAAVAKVRTKWPDNNDVKARVRKLSNLIGAEMKDWADEGVRECRHGPIRSRRGISLIYS